MYEKEATRTWEALSVPPERGKPGQRIGGGLKTDKESDQLILLRGQENCPHGEGVDSDT